MWVSAMNCTSKFTIQDINALAMDSRHNLLSASSDGSLAAYEVRKCKLRMKSETMHSELLSLCVTDKSVVVSQISLFSCLLDTSIPAESMELLRFSNTATMETCLKESRAASTWVSIK